jgi:multidrug transporter EmrE-like cation transporter
MACPFFLGFFFVAFNRLILLTFYYSNLCSSEANSGIISSIFTTNVVFSVLIFYFMFDEKLSFKQLIGILMIIGSVFMVSQGHTSSKKKSTSNEKDLTQDEKTNYLILSIICAVSVGLCLGICAFIIRYAVHKHKFSKL